MNWRNGLKINKIILMFLVILIMFTSFEIVNADDFGEGEGGGDTTESEYGYWHVAEGPNAWSKFKSIQSSQRGWDWLVNWINKNGLGYQYPDGSRESMENTCKRSEYIWWYGKNAGRMLTQAKGTNNAPQSHWKPMSNMAKQSLEVYKSWSNLWSGGQVVIICSAAYESPAKVPLKLVAKSGTFTYDGNPKTVKGIDTKKSNLSQLKPGHRYSATVKRTETNVGAYPVTVQNPRVYDSSNRNVTDQYAITTQDGVLIINRPDEIIDETDNWRCIDTKSDSATAYVFNTTKGYHGFTPSGAPNLNSTYQERWTPAGNHARFNAPPGPGSSLSSWNSWKSTFQAGSDTKTPELNLEGAGVSGVLSKYGGVYNISRSLRKDTYNITHCQPQTRKLETKTYRGTYMSCVTNPEGKKVCTPKSYSYTYTEWTPWKNDGGRIVWTRSGPSENTTHNNYQLLSVNCNKDGFNNVRSSIGGTILSLANGDGGAILQTPERSGQGPGPLGSGSHITARSSFYNDGSSCKEAFVCTVSPKSNARNDANNNQNNKHLFAEYKEDENSDDRYGFPNDNGEIIFFRDNNDRQVRADIWYPRPTGKSDLESYSGNAAKRTFAKIYNNPTPEIELTRIAPWTSKNDTINYINSEKVYNGNVNRFLMKSQWASDKDKPYKLGVNWEYKATGKNIVPKIVDGYTVKSMTSPYIYDFDVYCDFRNNKGDYRANIPATPFAYGYTSRTWNTNNAIRTLFTRSVSDMTK